MIRTVVPVQQRRVMRRALRVDCQVVRERDFRLVGRRGLDLSPDGMLVMLEEPVLTGEPLLVTFRLPLVDRWIDAQAVVARVLHGRRPGDRGQSFGVEFEPLEPAAQALLRHALRGVPPPLPMRAQRLACAARARPGRQP